MQWFRWLLCFLVLGCPLEGRTADKPASAIDELLNAWCAASQNCRSLDSRLTVLVRDLAFADRTEKGRLYFEAPNQGRFQVGADTDILWKQEARFYLTNRTKSFDRITAKQVETFRRREAELSKQRDRSWFGNISLELAQAFLIEPQDAIPCLLLSDSSSKFFLWFDRYARR